MSDREPMTEEELELYNQRQTELNDIRFAMQEPITRRVLHRLLGYAKMYEPLYVPGSFDMTARNLGAKEYADWIRSELEQGAKDLCVVMSKENDNA